MSQLCNIFRIATVAIEEMTILDQLTQLLSTTIPLWAFYYLIANWGPRHHDQGNLVLDAKSYLVDYVESRISHNYAYDFASLDTFWFVFAFSDAQAYVDLEGYFATPA